ncbi:MAG: hypothetical protein RH917_09040 [Lacipirellulaceae bacterium]
MSSVINNKSVESLDENSRGVRVEFFQLADRYCHKIYLVAGERSVLALESVEAGISSNHESPAYQDLNLEEIAGRKFAALVGMSGSCHWSLTVEPSNDPQKPGILFDAACRMKAAIPRVSSVYQLSYESTLASGEAIHSVKTPLGKLDIAALPLKDEPQGTPPVEVAYHQQELLVRREIAPPDQLPATVRWRYTLSLSREA